MNDYNKSGFWVFGYGSLVWQPDFSYSAREIARLGGFERSFCMRSIHHRGTQTAPGLVLALDPAAGAFCDGVGFFVEPGNAAETLANLRERELISAAYLEQVHVIDLRDGHQHPAVCYVVDTDHVQYCGGLALEEQARIIAGAVGGRGPNTDYLFNTAAHLRDLGIEDRDMSWLERRVRELGGCSAN